MKGALSCIARFAVAIMLAAVPAFASETTVYTYDELGRLVGVAVTGSAPTSGQAVTTTFDPAGNRTNFSSSLTSLAIASASVTEGGALVFTVTRSGITTSAVSASYSSASGTATSGSDFNAASGTVSFAANQTTATVNVTTIDDTASESAESMSVTLSAPSSGAAITTATGTGTINDNDAPPAQLAIGNASATEGGNLVFAVTRSGTTATAVSASFVSASGTATSGVDFTAASGTVSFAANQTTATVNVTTIDDTASESAETITVALSNPSANAAITTSSGTGTISDNDSGWTSSLTSGTWEYCYFVCSYFNGYLSGTMGSMSNTTFNGHTVSGVYNSDGLVIFYLTGTTVPPNSGWTTITIPGIGTLNRASASYYSDTASPYALWLWTNPGIVASGSVTIQ